MSDALIPEGWTQVKLGDVCEVNSQSRNKHYPYLSIKYLDISSVGEGHLLTAPTELAVSNTPSRAQRIVKFGDVLLSTVRPERRSIYRVSLHDNNLIASTGFAALRTNTNLCHQRFLYYLVFDRTFTEYLVTREQGAAYPSIRPLDIVDADILLPPLHEQKAIAHILGSLDDKIDQLRKTNSVLEDMASALFKSWFVDFDPVKAKQENRPTGLPPELDALFPDSFEDSSLGPIPKGWRVAKFCEVSSAIRGLSYSGEHLSDNHEGKPLHNLNSILEGGAYKYSGIKYYRGAYKTQHIVRAGELLVANTEQGFENLLIGFAAITPDTFGKEGLFSHHLYKLSFNDTSPIRETYTFYWINNVRNHDAICRFANGTTVNMLPIDALSRSLITIPCKALIDTFDDVSKSSTVGLFEHQIRTLTNLRDTLLPKLISGQLRVPEAEQMVAELGL